MPGRHVWQGGMCGREACMAEKACMAGRIGGMYGGGGMHGRQGTCVAGGMHDRGACIPYGQ